MVKEIKISLPVYKIAYSLFFIVILSLIRGVTLSYEVGIALEAPMAMLAAAFCADTYAQELASKRSEVWRLYPIRKSVCSVMKRMLIQEIFLFLLAVTGYALFFVFQKPFMADWGQFLVYLPAIAITLCFWGNLSNILAGIFRSMWVGIGGCLVLWIITNSSVGDRYLGSWNLFSYTFRDVENSGDLSWMWGKLLCICFSFIMMALLPQILERRG